MPNNKRHTAKTVKGKDAVHPASRKAGQMDRIQLRTVKLQRAASKRRGDVNSKFARPSFFLSAISSPLPITLESLRALISDVYLARHDDEIARLESTRRAGQPKKTALVDLLEQKRREMAEWRTGFEVLDLTHTGTTRLLWRWQQQDTPIHQSNLHLLRMIRLTSADPTEITLVRQGQTEKMGLDQTTLFPGEAEAEVVVWTDAKEVEMKE